jgi:hypothetical protein
MDEKLSRRDLFQHSAALGVLVVVGAGACGKPQKKLLVCSDTSALSASDMQVRASLAYADIAPDPTKMCVSCQQFLPGAPDACGTCKVLKGPVSPAGNCKAYAAKAT